MIFERRGKREAQEIPQQLSIEERQIADSPGWHVKSLNLEKNLKKGQSHNMRRVDFQGELMNFKTRRDKSLFKTRR